MKLKIIFNIIALFLVSSFSFSQTATLTGIVHDSKSKALHYANISVVGHSIGTTSDKKDTLN